MKRKFFNVAKRNGINITSYLTHREIGMGGLQVFHIEYEKNGKTKAFDDSYFHLSGDAHKVVSQFETELKQ